MELHEIISRHLRQYPGMEPEDCLKLVYQGEFGPGHLIEVAGFEPRLVQEIHAASRQPSLFASPEDIGYGLCRVQLSHLPEGLCAATLTRLCALTASHVNGSLMQLRQKLLYLCAMETEDKLPYAKGRMERCVTEFLRRAESGEAVIPRHSERFNALYHPHYRLLASWMAAYLEVFAAVDMALGRKGHVLVGIDGMSAAGKSGLAALLQQVYGCGVVHTDDFFLRDAQRTRERLLQPGGNIDYERLAPVAAKAADDRAFTYLAYNCASGTLETQRDVPPGRLTLLEGGYALHPQVDAACDVRVFLSVEAGEQARRIAARNTPELAERFMHEWIPMENRYFGSFDIREGCDVTVDTTLIFE